MSEVDMKRIIAAMLIMMCIFFMGCEKAMSNNDALIERARKEIPLADIDNTDVVYAGLVVKNSRALVWFIAGNEYEAKTYYAMECEVINDKGMQNRYRFIRMIDVMDDRGSDIAICNWLDGYCFLVNNENCDKIVIKTDKTREYPIKDGAYPYIEYADPFISGEYYFYDIEGNEIK